MFVFLNSKLVELSPEENTNIGQNVGVFDTIAIRNARLHDVSRHLHRLHAACKRLNLTEVLVDESQLEKSASTLIEQQQISRGALRISITKENKKSSASSNLLLQIRPFEYTEAQYQTGITLKLEEQIRDLNSQADIKLSHRKSYAASRARAKNSGFDDVLFHNQDQTLLECSYSNIVFVRENSLYTPLSEGLILSGTKLQEIIEYCSSAGISICQQNISIESINDYTAAFICNAVMGIMPVRSIGELKLQVNHALLRKVQQAMN